MMYRTIPEHGAAVTPSDTVDLNPTALIYVGGAGNIVVTTKAGDKLTFNGVLAGVILPVAVSRVWATSTTATNMIACW